VLPNEGARCPTRSSPDYQMSAGIPRVFGVVERAAAETPINREQAAASPFPNDLGNTPRHYHQDERSREYSSGSAAGGVLLPG